MDWIRNAWSRRQDGKARKRPASASSSTEPRGLEEWAKRLQQQGVSAEWAATLARRLEPMHRELGPGSAEAILRTAATTVDAQAEAHATVERNLRDVREVERLLGAFSGELEKLDEVLEVLAAYAQRMRTKPNRKARHTLH